MQVRASAKLLSRIWPHQNVDLDSNYKLTTLGEQIWWCSCHRGSSPQRCVLHSSVTPAPQGHALLLKISHKSFMELKLFTDFFCISLKLHTSKYISDRSCNLLCRQKGRILGASVCAPNHPTDWWDLVVDESPGMALGHFFINESFQNSQKPKENQEISAGRWGGIPFSVCSVGAARRHQCLQSSQSADFLKYGIAPCCPETGPLYTGWPFWVFWPQPNEKACFSSRSVRKFLSHPEYNRRCSCRSSSREHLWAGSSYRL